MENASKALVMAGAVLIAVGVITLALYVYSVFSSYANTMETVYSASQVESFNRFYESYPEGTIRGVDALNLYRKACDDDVVVHVDTPGVDFEDLQLDQYLTEFTYRIEKRDGSGRVAQISLVN